MIKCCLCCSEVARTQCLELNNSQDDPLSTRNMISKHLSFIIADFDIDVFCCLACLKELFKFHKFYEKIKSKHYRGVFVKCETFEDESLINEDSNEQNDIGETTTEFTNPLKVLQRSKKRGRPVINELNPLENSLVGIEEISKDLLSRKVSQRVTEIDEQKILSSINMVCDLCNIPLESLKAAVAHHRENHNQKGYLMCCSRKFLQRSALMRHLEVHSNPERFQSQLCEKNLSSHSNLRTHVTVSHLPLTEFQCDVCGEFVNYKNRLAAHLKTHFIMEKTAEKFVCIEKDCEKIYKSQYGLKTHIRNCHNPQRDTFSCEVCGKQLMTRSSLKDHVENTHADKIVKIQCHLCGHYIKNKYSMKKHLNRHKQMTEDISCEHCGKKCTTKAALRSHLLMKHLLQRTFKCSFCEKSFKQAIDQKEHEATHTGVDLYSCLWCSATFKFGANFRAHRKNSHPEEYEKIKPAWLRPN